MSGRLAVDPHARPARLRHPDDVEAADAHLPLDARPQLLRPHLGAEDGRAEPRPAEVEALLPRHLHHAERVRRDAAQDGGLEVPDELELEERPPCAHRDHHGPEGLGAVVEAEAAGEEPEGRGDRDHVLRRHGGGGEGAGHDLPPLPDVGRRVGVDDRRPRRARGHVDPEGRLVAEARHPEGIGVTEPGLGEEREPSHVLEAPQVPRIRFAEVAVVVAAPRGDPGEGVAQPLELQGLERLARACLLQRLEHARVF